LKNDDDLVPGIDKPKRGQYVIGALVILVFALILWVLKS